eukprot:TRINITY_DN6968_c1_g1_i3.p1 TRINITY_DN6968_c1_g1~~TRINITY_DN6968_c1_g1_i3.p1  ORF type:complete len:227 (+),score=-0.76 TRINITY_DN6968_c1_g1_i3:141-821(+)
MHKRLHRLPPDVAPLQHLFRKQRSRLSRILEKIEHVAFGPTFIVCIFSTEGLIWQLNQAAHVAGIGLGPARTLHQSERYMLYCARHMLTLKEHVQSEHKPNANRPFRQHWRLQERWQNHPAARVLRPAILAVKELLQTPVLCKCPLNHLCCSAETKQRRRQALRRDRKEQPSPDLKSVVGTRDIVEEMAFRDLISGVVLAQVGKGNMGNVVTSLANVTEYEAHSGH